MRFSSGLITPLELTSAQQDEALAVIHAVLDEPRTHQEAA
jgi:hypothetical protein